MPPRIVPLPGNKPPSRKRRGRGLAEVLAAAQAALMDAPTPDRVVGADNRSHMSYDRPSRVEHARHLNARARGIIGVEDFHARAI